MAIVIPTDADAVLGSFKVNLSDFPVNGTLSYYTADPGGDYPAYFEFKFTPTEDLKKAAADILGLSPEDMVISYAMADDGCSISVGP